MPVAIVPTNQGPLAGDLPGELEVAARALRAAPCASVSFRIETPRAITAGDDGVVSVVFETKAWPSELLAGVAAQTVLRVDAAGFFRDADIHLNAVDHRFTIDGSNGTVDLRGVLTHELGHVVGLGHSTDPTATMFASVSDVATWRSIESDDVTGLCSLYPGAGRPACSASDPCPAGFVCTAARCERPRDPRATCAPCAPGDPTTCAPNGARARCLTSTEPGFSLHRCGRPCERTEDCGDGFQCVETTEAGDRQCVGGCANGTWRCESDADCDAPAVCHRGSCALRVGTDAGPRADDGGGSLPATTPEPLTGAGGCSVSNAAHARVDGDFLAALAALLVTRWRTRPSWARSRASCRAHRSSRRNAR